MARNMYGATSADFTITSGGRVIPGATLTIWSARTGGTQVTDLLDRDSVATTTVTSGADGSVVYYGPNNDKTVHWADSGQGARIAIRPVDITGDPPVLSIGTVTTGTAAASLTGTSEAPVLNLTLPTAGANGVDTAAIQSKAVTAAKIADDTITAAQIAANAVGASELADNAVDTNAIADNAVTSAKIADGTITSTDVAASTFAAFGTVGNLLTANQASIETSAPSFGANRLSTARDTTEFYRGTASLKLTTTATGTTSLRIPQTGTNGLAVVAGEPYTGHFFAKAPAITTAASAVLQWWDASGNALTSDTGTTAALSTSWRKYTTTAIAPANAAYVTLYVQWIAAAIGEVVFVDAIGIWRGSSGRWSMPGEPIIDLAPGDGTVTAASMGTAAVGTAALIDGSVTPAKTSAPLQSGPTWITTFQPGHGWTKSSGTSIGDDTTTYKTGSQSLLINTAAADKTGLALDLTDRDLIVDLRIVGTPGAGATLTILAGGSGLSAYRSWLVYDESLSSRQFNGDEWMRLRLAWLGGSVTGSPSRSAVDTIRIAMSGGTAQVNVQAVGYAPSAPANRRGVVSFTFDDGWATQLRGANILGARGIAGTAYIIPQELGGAGYLTVAQARSLRTDYGWELQAHNTPQYPGQSESALRTLLSDTVGLFASMGLGPRPQHVAYPGGQNDALSAAVAGEFFDTGRTIAIQRGEPLPVASPMHLRCVSGIGEAGGGGSISTAQGHIDRAIATRGWAILAFHKITPGAATDPMECSEAGLGTLADYALSAGAEVLTVSECWDRYGRR